MPKPGRSVRLKLRINDLSVVAAIFIIVGSLFRFPIVADVRFSFQLFFFTAVIGLTAWKLWFVNKWWALFLILAWVSTHYPAFTNYSYVAFFSVYFGVVFYYLLASGVSNFKLILNAICIVSLCNVFYMIMQCVGYDPIFSAIEGEGVLIVGLMANKNGTSALIGFCFPAFLRRKWCWFLPLCYLGLVLSSSWGGMLAASTAFIVYSFGYENRKLILMGVGWGVLSCVLFQLYVDKLPISVLSGEAVGVEGIRWLVWNETLSNFFKRPFMGGGLGHFKVVFSTPEIQARLGLYFAQTHNDILQGMFEMGVGFGVILAGYFINIWRRFTWKAILPLSALIGIVVNSLVNFPFHVGTTAMLAITWMGILEISLREGV